MSTTPLRYCDGAAVATARRDANLTQAELAELVGASQVLISYVESGRRDPSLRLLSRLADVLGVARGPFLRSENQAVMHAAENSKAAA